MLSVATRNARQESKARGTRQVVRRVETSRACGDAANGDDETGGEDAVKPSEMSVGIDVSGLPQMERSADAGASRRASLAAPATVLYRL